MFLASHPTPAQPHAAGPFRSASGVAAATLGRTLVAASLAVASLATAPAASAQTVLAESQFNDPGAFYPTHPAIFTTVVDGWTQGVFSTGLTMTSNAYRRLNDLPFDAALFVSVPGSIGVAADSWMAPDKFLGDQRAALGGALVFDLNGDGATVGSDGVRLSSSGVELYFPLAAPNSATSFDFKRYVVPLDPGAGWQTAGATKFLRTPSTMAEMTFVLGNLESLIIRGDYFSPGETGAAYLDNVRLVSSVPEPATALLWACGLAVAGLKLRRAGPAQPRGAAA